MDNASFEPEALIDGDCCVSYHPNPDLVHIPLNRLSKWCIVVTYYGVIVLRHDDVAVALWVVLGYVINIALSFSLNQIIYQDWRLDSEVASGPGMPYFHAQPISFTNYMFQLLDDWDLMHSAME
ncbi:hypothetical protein L6452_40236 [Arctium lappa]|uniref:Uncharacterized protein n=1 Tax=Arctium lappa TaxID=4217 RepID=A0ACB8XM49_ARCLA|nr:hypothetical protein L6452_40236 [Arctium lappa]